MVDYSIVFHSINDDSSDFSYFSNQASSSTVDTSDSDWQQTEEKSNSTRSVDSFFQTHLLAPIKMASLQYMMQNNIPDQSQITYKIMLVKILTIKNKLYEMVMSAKNNLQRIAQKKTVNMKTAFVKVFH